MVFRWKDAAHGNDSRLMMLSADEFLRRFLLHVLARAPHQNQRNIQPGADSFKRLNAVIGLPRTDRQAMGVMGPDGIPIAYIVSRCINAIALCRPGARRRVIDWFLHQPQRSLSPERPANRQHCAGAHCSGNRFVADKHLRAHGGEHQGDPEHCSRDRNLRRDSSGGRFRGGV